MIPTKRSGFAVWSALLFLPLLSGCAADYGPLGRDLVFGIFGKYHSDAYTQAERQANYRQQFDSP